jgi:hypothetical protein
VTLRVTDSGDPSLSFEKTFKIYLIDIPGDEPNHTPSDILLSNSSIDENSEWGTVVGTLTGIDQDGGDVLTYSIIENPLDPHGSFEIAHGNRLVVKAGAILDRETRSSYDVTVRVTDLDGATYDKTFAITVNDVADETNDAPINLTLSNSTVQDGTTGGVGGTLVGTVSATDPNGDRLFYTLDFHDKFELVGTELRLKEGQTVDYDEAQSYALWGYAYDRFGAIVEQQFTITVVQNRGPNHAPTNIELSNSAVHEGKAKGFVIGRLSADDLDGDTVTFTLFDDADGRFELGQQDGATVLKVADGVRIDYEQLQRLSITVRADDGHQGITDQVIQIDVQNLLRESLEGTEGDDRIQGGIGDDRFWGRSGADTLIGGGGKDILEGGEGADVFVFHRLGTDNSDTIVDFDVMQDKIQLVKAYAFEVMSPGALSESAFRAGTQAMDADDRIIYDQTSGRLLYDGDGRGGRAALEVAILQDRVTLDHTHFVVTQFLL